jgi:hypothetical protein
MALTLLIAAAVAGGAPAVCVKAGEVEGTERAWYRNADPISIEGRTYVKYGLPRTGIGEYVELLTVHDGVPVTVEKGAREHDVLYLLADTADCSLQPYQVEAK